MDLIVQHMTIMNGTEIDHHQLLPHLSRLLHADPIDVLLRTTRKGQVQRHFEDIRLDAERMSDPGDLEAGLVHPLLSVHPDPCVDIGHVQDVLHNVGG